MNIETCTIRNSKIMQHKIWFTHRRPSHRWLMRRGTPLTRSWFMPALNTQQFATAFTHPLTCLSHAEYHYCVIVYQSDVKSELQSVCKKKKSRFTRFTLFSKTHTSIDKHSSCRIPLLCDCLSIWCAIWATKCLQIEHLRVLLFPRKHINHRLENTAVQNDVSACLI